MNKNKCYHFDLHNSLQVNSGEIFNTNNGNNPSFNKLKVFAKENFLPEWTLALEQLDFISDDNVFKNIINRLDSDYFHDGSMITRWKVELKFEFIRQKEFRQIPSRLKCIFLTETLIEWHEHIRRAVDEKNATPVFYAFDCTHANLFIADSTLYEEACRKIANQSYDEAEDMILQYWEGKGDGRKEILCEGELRVVNKSFNMESL